ncbi:MAG: LD-carboxypeptidase [Bacteroidota bacterium]|nr:LD-carboxypeptidase [Bacteroidota bacterium]
MNYPAPLIKGDRIEIVSPAGKIAPSLIDAAGKRITAGGYRVSISPHAKGSFHTYSGTDEDRLADLQHALDNPEVKAVCCARGGYGSMRIVDTINFDAAVEQQKWLIGYSDITALHVAAFNHGLASLHGIMAKDLVSGSSEAVNHFFASLRGDNPDLQAPSHPLNRMGKATGVLLGGNLSMLYALRGTAYDIDWNGAILFIEDIGEHLYHLDRIMQNLRLGGKLKNLAGLLVGQFTDMQDTEFGKSAYDIIAEAVSDYRYPVAFDMPFGHVAYSRSLLHGANAGLECRDTGCVVDCKL